MLTRVRNTCLSLSLGLIVSGFLTLSIPAALISVPFLMGSGIAAGMIGIGLEVIRGGHRV